MYTRNFVLSILSFENNNNNKNPFSAIALNQADEQNNTVITGVGSAVGLFSKDMDSALKRWEVARPEVCRLLEE